MICRISGISSISIRDRDRFIETVEKQGFTEAFEVQFRKKNGEKMWVSLKSRAIRDKEGKTLYYEGMAENITERKRVEAEIRESRNSSGN
jgi:PAS domain S-box-containing protein